MMKIRQQNGRVIERTADSVHAQRPQHSLLNGRRYQNNLVPSRRCLLQERQDLPDRVNCLVRNENPGLLQNAESAVRIGDELGRRVPVRKARSTIEALLQPGAHLVGKDGPRTGLERLGSAHIGRRRGVRLKPGNGTIRSLLQGRLATLGVETVGKPAVHDDRDPDDQHEADPQVARIHASSVHGRTSRRYATRAPRRWAYSSIGRAADF